MGKRIATLLTVLTVLFALCPVSAAAAGVKINITIEDTVVSYNPDGYYPTAKANYYNNELKYEVTDNSTGQLLELPVKAAGNYTVRAYMEETAFHSGASATASLTVEKAEVYISVTENVVAHTAMDNPVKYSIVPEWATPFVEMSISYLAISDYSDTGTAVAVPKDPGKYLVRFDARVGDDNIVCAGKYLVYEIAERAGAPLSDEDAIRSVPRDFSASVESINVTYSDSYEPPKYHANVAGVQTKLMYSHLYANGTMGAYTDELPTTPGDYVVSCFVLDTVIGSGKIIIDKQIPKIEMADLSFTYTPEGVYPPAATVTPAGIDIVYKAYEYKDGVIGDSVSFPLTECGSYLVSAQPENTSLYSFVVSYCNISIVKASPVITAENRVHTEDGTPKPLELSVAPDFVQYELSYYQLKDGTAFPMDSAPVSVGDYYATVTVKATDGVESLTKVYGIRIVAPEDKSEKVFSHILQALCVLISATALFVGCYDLLAKNRRN